jgi:hypothetical protein
MAYFIMLRCDAFVRPDVSEKRVILVRADVSEEGTEISVLTRARRRNIPESVVLHSHRRENLKSHEYNVGNRDLLTIHLILSARW